MGCLGSKESTEDAKETDEKPVYSWDKRERIDPKDYTVGDVSGVTSVRMPGTVNGQQFIIVNCQDCNIYVFDHNATVSVDDCINCRIFIGPSKGSIFFRDCKDCKAVVACQQFRTRDCKKMDFFLCCATQPIIESSSGMKFACFQYYYPELEGQFKAAGLSVFNNNWSNIHDFTPAPGETTWSLLPEDSRVEDFVPLPSADELSGVEVSTDPSKSVVPLTLGSRRKPHDESCLVVFFYDGHVQSRIQQFMEELRAKGSYVLVKTKQITMKADDAARVFQCQDYNTAAEQGPVVGLEVNGENCVQRSKESAQSASASKPGAAVYVSDSAQKAVQDTDAFYNFVDMSMS